MSTLSFRLLNKKKNGAFPVDQNYFHIGFVHEVMLIFLYQNSSHQGVPIPCNNLYVINCSCVFLSSFFHTVEYSMDFISFLNFIDLA